MDDALSDRISFRRFVGWAFSHDPSDASTICPFRNHLAQRGLDARRFGISNQHFEAQKPIVKQRTIVDTSIMECSRRPRRVEVVEELEAEKEDDPLPLGQIPGHLEGQALTDAGRHASNLKKATLMME